MFQIFDDINEPELCRSRIAALRETMKRRKLDGFIVPRADEFQGEYVAPYAERLRWLTGFSGSAGHAIVLARKAAIFVDGRYTLQVVDQVDTDIFEILEVPENKPTEWLKKHIKKGDRIGYDPWLHTIETVDRLINVLKLAGAKLVPLKVNLVDQIWTDQPPRPEAPVVSHPLKYAGESAQDKVKRIQDLLKKANQDAVVLTLPDSIAWLTNIRGSDVPHTPLPLSYAIVHARKKPELFIAPAKLGVQVRKQLEKVVRLLGPEALEERLTSLGQSKVRLDSDSAASWFGDVLKKSGAILVDQADPCIGLKAVKNRAEIEGARQAHERDGIAMCRFLAWLHENGDAGQLDEIKAARQLEQLRAETGALKDISFDTISAVGRNGAIVHYRVNSQTNAKFRKGTLYLVDSGAQYQEGTTDITRTVAIGRPSREMQERFTLVLKGHIGLASARFPKGTRGQDLDPLARNALWSRGLDFNHGTGHGVGSYLSVHEGPQRIARTSDVVLEPGMILSNEPGYYKEGAYGIRIENLVLVSEGEIVKGGEREMLSFETLTLAPIDLALVETTLLTPDEKDWLNQYHARVRKVIGPKLAKADRAWLVSATREI